MDTLEKKSLIKKLSELNVLIILAGIGAIAAILTWIIPAGAYDVVTNTITGQNVVDATSFKYVAKTPVSLGAFLKSFQLGIVKGSSIFAFLLIVGGSFGVMNDTGALSALTAKIIQTFKSNASKELIICATITLFAVGGAIWGWCLECFAFAPFLIMLTIALGYDGLMGVGIVTVGVNIGYHAAFINPFSIGIAQEIAEVPYLSGMGLRLAIFVFFDLLACAFIIMYGRKITKDPSKSLSYGVKYDFDSAAMLDPAKVVMTKKHKQIIAIFTMTIILMIFGAMKLSWFITEISTLFLVMGVVMGIVNGYGLNGTVNRFVEGTKDMLTPALIIGFSNSIILILNQGNILDTVIHGMVQPLAGLPAIVCAPLLVLIQTVVNFFIVSSSGQAAVAMPILVPVADLLGVSRQVSVLAYQFGDGITDILFFTSAAVPISVGLAKVSLGTWFKFIGKFTLLVTAISMVIVSVAQYAGY